MQDDASHVVDTIMEGYKRLFRREDDAADSREVARKLLSIAASGVSVYGKVDDLDLKLTLSGERVRVFPDLGVGLRPVLAQLAHEVDELRCGADPQALFEEWIEISPQEIEEWAAQIQVVDSEEEMMNLSKPGIIGERADGVTENEREIVKQYMARLYLLNSRLHDTGLESVLPQTDPYGFCTLVVYPLSQDRHALLYVETQNYEPPFHVFIRRLDPL